MQRENCKTNKSSRVGLEDLPWDWGLDKAWKDLCLTMYHYAMKWIKEKIISKLPAFADLLQLDLAMRRNRITVQPLPGMGADVDREEWRPWHVIPNIQRFEIILRPYDWLLLIFGLHKKYSPDQTFYVWRNSPANRYIDYMFKRLRKEVELKQYHKASKTLWLCMNSTSYQVASFNHVFKSRWHRSFDLNLCKSILRKLRHLVKTKSYDLKYERVYIPKDVFDASKGMRPLGVPNPEWRVYLHMYNNLLTEWRMVSEGNNQHGYIPKRGVITAWTRLSQLLKVKPNIFEADFKGFFDSIVIKELTYVLWSIGLPALEAAHVEQLNRSLVKLKEMDLILEPSRTIIYDSIGRKNPDLSTALDPTVALSYQKGQIIPDIFHETDLRLMTREGAMNALLQGTLTDMHIFRNLEKFSGSHLHKEVGVPQGAATSCSLATLALRPLEDKMRRDIPQQLYSDILKIYGYLPTIVNPTEIDSLLHKLIQRITSLYDDVAKLEKLDSPQLLRNALHELSFTKKNYELYLSFRNIAKKFWGKGEIIFYADDVIYFPDDPEEDPISVLENAKLGIAVNKAKSHWVKRNGTWLVDYIKFLGFRYYPAKPLELKTTEWGITLATTLAWDTFMWNSVPITTAIALIGKTTAYSLKSRERFVADTRKGATLEFTNRESFLIYLDNARDYLLDGSITPREREEIIKKGLRSWLKEHEVGWSLLRSKVALLWTSKNLKGWIFSRMQSDTWHISVNQDFSLKAKPKSWASTCWPKYALDWNLDPKKLNVFNCSSFACHWLLDYLNKSKVKVRSKSRVRYVYTNPKPKEQRKKSGDSKSI